MIVNRDAIIQPLQAAHRDWYSSPNIGSKYVEFDVMAEEIFGIKIMHTMSKSYGVNRFSHIEVIDQKKYVEFLLRWIQ